MVCNTSLHTLEPPQTVPSQLQGHEVYKRPSAISQEISKQQAAPSYASETFSIPSFSSVFSKPKITHPSRVPFHEMGLIQAFEDLHATGEKLITTFTKSLQDGKEKLRTLSLENIEKLKEAALRAQESGFWSMLQKIGECILAAISTVLGVSLVASGAGSVIGGVMIASGILTLANFAMRETGSWDFVAKKLSSDQDMQKKLVVVLPMATSLVATVLSLGGSVATSLWTSLSMTQKALAFAQTAMSFYQGFTTAGKGLAEAKALWTQADLALLDMHISIERAVFESKNTLMRHVIKIFEQSKQTAEQVIDLAAQAIKKTKIHV
jgi:hypothetical protein